MDYNLNIGQREAAEAVWRGISERKEIVLGLKYDAQKDDVQEARRDVASTVGLLDRAQTAALVEPDARKHGPVRRDFIWLWSPSVLGGNSPWPR